MADSLQRTDREITELYQRHVDTVYRVCYSYMKNRADTEDMVQDTFIKLISSGVLFQSAEHEKAWLIVTASNLCKTRCGTGGGGGKTLTITPGWAGRMIRLMR